MTNDLNVWRCPCGVTGPRTTPPYKGRAAYRRHLVECEDFDTVTARQILWRVLG